MKSTYQHIDKIEKKINEIKHNAKSTVFTNYFRQQLNAESLCALQSDNSIIFLDQDIDFHRLYFYSSNLTELHDTIMAVEITPTTIDYITKVPSKDLVTILSEAGFRNIAVYKRIINNNLPAHRANSSLSFARKEELEFLHNRLFTDFGKYLDHFPTIEKLGEFIKNMQVIVVRERHNISGYIIYQLYGRKVFLNYWFNEGNPLNSLLLLTNFYGLMHEKGIKSGFGWVNEKNTGVIKTHQKFGYKFDGLQDHIFLR